MFDLAQNIPERDVVLIGTTANLVVKDDLHPALAYLLLRAAAEVHNAPTLFSGLRAFPAPNDTELPLSPEAARFYKSGPPLLQRYLPYWGANLVDRLLVLLLPALVVLIPAARLLPQLYRWRVRSRIYRWYAILKEIELELEERRSPEELEHILERLEKIDDAVHRIETPLAYSENLYVFRQHIDLVRQRAQLAIQRAGRNAADRGAATARSPRSGRVRPPHLDGDVPNESGGGAMKKLLLVVVVAIAAYFGYVQQHPRISEVPVSGISGNDAVLASAFEKHASNIQVQGQGLGHQSPRG